MKEKNILSSVGILVYIVMSIIDKFFYKVPGYIYILVGVLAILLIIIGFIKDRKK